MADDEVRADTITRAIRAAAEGAASGTATTIAALGQLKGEVLARLDDGSKRMDEIRDSVARVERRLEERTDRLAEAMQTFGQRMESHEQRIGSLEGARKTAATWLRDSLGWILGAGAVIWATVWTTRHH